MNNGAGERDCLFGVRNKDGQPSLPYKDILMDHRRQEDIEDREELAKLRPYPWVLRTFADNIPTISLGTNKTLAVAENNNDDNKN